MDESLTSESSDHEETFPSFQVIRRESAINCDYSEIFEPNFDDSSSTQQEEYYGGSTTSTSETSDHVNNTFSYDEDHWLTQNTFLEHGFVHVENLNPNTRQKYVRGLNTRYFNQFNIRANKSLLIREDILQTQHNFIVYNGSTHESVEESRETYTCERLSYPKLNMDADDSDSSQDIEEDMDDDKSIQHSEKEFESFSEDDSSELGASMSFLEDANESSGGNEPISVQDHYRIHIYNQTYVVSQGFPDQAQRKCRKLEQEAYAKLRRNLKLQKRDYKRRLLVNEVNKLHTRKSIDKDYKEEINFIENDIRKRKISLKESLMAHLEEEKHLLKSERNLKLSDDPALVRLAAYYRKLRKRTSGTAVKEEVPRSINLLLDEKDIEEDLKVIIESCQSESEESTTSTTTTSTTSSSDDYTSEE